MLVIATPMAGTDPLCALVTQGYSEHVRALSHELGAVVVPAVVSYGGSHVHSRNRTAAAILRDYPDMTTVLWWDSDQWPEDRNLASAMLATGEDLIAAPYTTKERVAKFTHKVLPTSRPIGGLMQVAAVGFGFTMTSRSCLERVSAAARVYTEDGKKIPDIFAHAYEETYPGCAEEEMAKAGEDFSFCRRWRDLGGKVQLFLNAGIIIHAGVYAYSARDVPGAFVEGAPAMAAE